jgi:hypothetical protein
MVAVLEEGVFEGLGTVDEQAAKHAVLLASNPVAATILANEHNGGSSRATRGRFDKFHVHSPSREIDMYTLQQRLHHDLFSTMFETSSARSMLDLTAPNICAVEYEFDGEGMPIS